ncbi:uncharacterized protein GGS22DRAFT_47584 [Annulohypoxylon maeteangense]|uniref:uncharacterized protein n=1 Tax=Annulohypoxylon maeteangense TaxID=1927788 RepID=UPI002008D094|nr:uncharacterized protein GGS22DRAFT_47584 [Annulohypoxylon maeteangense]KAI0882660.1 hypothetical protein GGS22DRAFT_47584 [Annulohypoxylon maeteangense]
MSNESKKRRPSESSTVSASSSFSLPTTSPKAAPNLQSESVQLPQQDPFQSGRKEHGEDEKMAITQMKQNGVETLNNISGSNSHINNGSAKPEKRPITRNLNSVPPEHLLEPPQHQKSTAYETHSDPAIANSQNQHVERDHAPSQKAVACKTSTESSGPAKDTPAKILSPLEKLQQKRQVQTEKANMPRWKMKAAQKKNKKSKDTEKEDPPYRPMNKSEYTQFCIDPHSASLRGTGKSDVKVQGKLVSGDIKKKPSGAKNTQADTAQKNEATAVKFKVGSAVLPKMTARIESPIADTDHEKIEDPQETHSEAESAASVPSSATLQAEEPTNRNDDTPRSPWDELVAAAVGALQEENVTLATEATIQGGVETAQPSTMHPTEDNLSRDNDAQTMNPADVTRPNLPRQDNISPLDESTLRNARSPKETNERVNMKPMVPDSSKKIDIDSNPEDNKRVQRVAPVTTREKNAKKKERKRKAAAAEWEKKAKTEQAKRELKEKRKIEQQEAEQRKIQKAREIEAIKANVPTRIRSDGGGGIRNPHSEESCNSAQKLSVAQKTDSTVATISDLIKTQELDHHQRTGRWIEQTSQHSGQPDQVLQVEVNEDKIPSKENDQKTKLWYPGESGNEREDKTGFEQAGSLSEHYTSLFSNAPALPFRYPTRRLQLVKGNPRNPDLILRAGQQMDAVYGRIESRKKDPQADKMAGKPPKSESNINDTSDSALEYEFSVSSSGASSFLSDAPAAHETLPDSKVNEESLPTGRQVLVQKSRCYSTPTPPVDVSRPESEP